MDFMKWLNSLDELLYEVMSWVVFFPLTLWQALFRPIRTMEEIERDHPQFVEPLLLRDVYGLPYDEIARLVGAPLGTVKTRLRDGMVRLRGILGVTA